MRQPRAVMPALVAVAVLVAVSVYGLIAEQDAATINNVSFAAFHISVLMTGCWAALAETARARAGVGAAGRGRGLTPPGASGWPCRRAGRGWHRAVLRSRLRRR